jgi:hypothetical protein
VALDPSNPAAREALREIVARMLGEDGIGADGLNVDFTGRTPGGTALSIRGRGWGIALIDTDDWRIPDLETWRAYLAVKSEFGVPSLYYASSLDARGESLTPDDYEELRRAWAAWRETGSTDRA